MNRTGLRKSRAKPAAAGIWLTGDTHMHYRYVGVEQIARRASEFCDFIVITSHSRRHEVFARQYDEVRAARRKFPNLLIFHGVEWEVPSAVHANVFFAPDGTDREARLLREFVGRFDRACAPGRPSRFADFVAGLNWLGRQRCGGVGPAVNLNHPEVRLPFTARHFRALAARKRIAGSFTGAGGHQARQSLDGAVHVTQILGRIGGLHDRLLAAGQALLPLTDSDFHRHATVGGSDYWPGEFSRQHVYCPDRSHAGVIRGLGSGCGYFTLGESVSAVRFSAESGGACAMMGQTLRVRRGESAAMRLRFCEITPVDLVEIIGHDGKRARVLKRARRREMRRDGPWRLVEYSPRGALRYVRARGRCAGGAKPYFRKRADLWFYTAAIFFSPAR